MENPEIITVWGITFIIVISVIGTQALIAYDCKDKSAEITAVSIRDVAECPELETSYKSESVKVKVVQRDEIKLEHIWTCYNELPILVDNQTKFMAPVTRVIQTHAEEVHCNGLMPPLYKIDDQWMGLSPSPTMKKTPEELSPETSKKLKFSPIQPVGALGIYTQEEISKAQRILSFGTERKAVENIIARKIAGLDTTGQGFSTVNLFNPDEMKELAHHTMQQVWGWFTDIGLFMSGLMGFYAIFRMIKYALGVVLNGIHLYQTLGCGFMIIASLWNTLTMWVMHKHRTKQDRLKTDSDNQNSEPLEEVTTSRIYPPLTSSAPHWTEEAK